MKMEVGSVPCPGTLAQFITDTAHKTDDTIVLSQPERTPVIRLSLVLLAQIPEI